MIDREIRIAAAAIAECVKQIDDSVLQLIDRTDDGSPFGRAFMEITERIQRSPEVFDVDERKGDGDEN